MIMTFKMLVCQTFVSNKLNFFSVDSAQLLTEEIKGISTVIIPVGPITVHISSGLGARYYRYPCTQLKLCALGRHQETNSNIINLGYQEHPAICIGALTSISIPLFLFL